MDYVRSSMSNFVTALVFTTPRYQNVPCLRSTNFEKNDATKPTYPCMLVPWSLVQLNRRRSDNRILEWD